MACNDADIRDEIVSATRTEFDDKPLVVLDANSAGDLPTFAQAVADCCMRLLHNIWIDQQPIHRSLHAYLSHAETCFRSNEQQGYFVSNHIDTAFEGQNTFEIEGPFREVMRFYGDVAILWLGSTEAMIEIGRYDRPFYLSHRVF